MNYLQKKKQAIIMMLAAQIIKTAQGYPVAINDCESGTAVDYTVYGNSVQDGTPTPESPVEIQSVGDLTKNLLPNDWESGFISVSSGANQDGLEYVRTKDYFTFDISKNYYISSDSIDTRTTISWYFYDENKNFISRFVSYKNRTIGTSGCEVTIPTNTVFFRLTVLTTDINIKVQIEEGSTATEYEPYHKYDIPITVTGKNLLKYPYYWTSRVRSGIMFTVNEDGTITLSGTTTLTDTAIDDFVLANAVTIKSGTYTVSGCPKGGAVYIYRIFIHIRDRSGKFTYISDIGNGATFTVTNTSTITTSIRIGAEIGTVNNLVFAPQIELGSTATAYEPYKGETKHIYLDEPLRKVGDYADYIDFKNQKVVRNVEVLDDTGTKTISESFGTLAPPTEETIALPALKTSKGKSIISADTTVLPSNIKVKYVRT